MELLGESPGSLARRRGAAAVRRRLARSFHAVVLFTCVWVGSGTGSAEAAVGVATPAAVGLPLVLLTSGQASAPLAPPAPPPALSLVPLSLAAGGAGGGAMSRRPTMRALSRRPRVPGLSAGVGSGPPAATLRLTLPPATFRLPDLGVKKALAAAAFLGRAMAASVTSCFPMRASALLPTALPSARAGAGPRPGSRATALCLSARPPACLLLLLLLLRGAGTVVAEVRRQPAIFMMIFGEAPGSPAR